MSDESTKSAAQDPKIVEGATTGDIEDEVAPTANSAEDRKAAAALSSLDATRDDDTSAKNVDQEAVKKAMDRLEGTGGPSKKTAEKKKEEVKRAAVKVDAADVTLVMNELELSKPKATELLKAHDGSAIKALTTYVTSEA